MTLTEEYAKWLDEKSPNPATLALVIGYIRQGNEQIESLIEKIENGRAEIDRLSSEKQKLKQQLGARRTSKRGISKNRKVTRYCHSASLISPACFRKIVSW